MEAVKNGQDFQVFRNAQFGEIRSLTINDTPWWVGKDVATALGYTNLSDALEKHVDAEDKRVIQKSQNATLDIPNRGLTIINESGLYSLILSSKLPTAKVFKRWVTSEVLPAIRDYGYYQKLKHMPEPGPGITLPALGLRARPYSPSPIPTTETYKPPAPAKKPEISIGEALKAVELLVKCKADRLPYVLEILRQTGFDFPETLKGGEQHGQS